MHKTPVICSLLLGFGLSAVMVGCEPPKAAKPVTKPTGKPAGSSSTTGGGAEVPAAPKKGAEETPAKAAEEAPAKAAETPAKGSDDAPKTETKEGDEAPKN
jgi:hypothetical protein